MRRIQETVRATKRRLNSGKHSVNSSDFCGEFGFLQGVAAWEISMLTGNQRKQLADHPVYSGIMLLL